MNMKNAIANAYASLHSISEEINIPVVEKSFGKGIIRVSCTTAMQLNNIPLIIKELAKFRLMAEIGMEPLAYSHQMNNFVLFIKPTNSASSQKLDHVFQKYSSTFFKYQHLVIDVPAENQISRKGAFKSKRIAVNNAYSSLRQILRVFDIPCVEETFGLGIIRVCCRTVGQLDNIALIMQEFLKNDLIEEVKMPLEYFYKMRSLVLFLKPMDVMSSMKMDYVFKKSSFEYHHLVIDIENPAAEEKTFQARAISFFDTSIASIWRIIMQVVAIITLLILTYEISKI